MLIRDIENLYLQDQIGKKRILLLRKIKNKSKKV